MQLTLREPFARRHSTTGRTLTDQPSFSSTDSIISRRPTKAHIVAVHAFGATYCRHISPLPGSLAAPKRRFPRRRTPPRASTQRTLGHATYRNPRPPEPPLLNSATPRPSPSFDRAARQFPSTSRQVRALPRMEGSASAPHRRVLSKLPLSFRRDRSQLESMPAPPNISPPG